MDISILFKIAAVGILVFALNLILKKADREEIGIVITIAGIIIVLLMVINMVGQLFSDIKAIFNLY